MKHYHFLRTLIIVLIGCSNTYAQETLAPVDGVPNTMLAEGYELELAVDGLNFPSALAFYESDIWVTEAGFPGLPPTVKHIQIDENGQTAIEVILNPEMLPMGTLVPPFTGLKYHNGMLWLSHRQVGVNGWNVGAFSRFNPNDPVNTFETVLTNLPSVGDHSNNTLVFGEDGRAYFGQGTATNTGVVGTDNIEGLWAGMPYEFHEMAPVDIELNGTSFLPLVPNSIDPEGDDLTAPYRPYGSGDIEPGLSIPAVTPDNPVNGIIIGSGTVYSFDPMADNPEGSLRLEAWGLRNPFGLAFDAEDPTRLFISNNGSDVRGMPTDMETPLDPATFMKTGTRPVENDEDDMFVITVGGDHEFFGWPDYFHDPETRQVLLASDPLFCQSPVLGPEDCPGPVFSEDFRNSLTVDTAFAIVGPHVSVTGFNPSTSSAFGYEGDLFVTESGSFAPVTGTFSFTGYKVSRIDRETAEEVDFLVNTGSDIEEILDPAAVNKPIQAVFHNDYLAVLDLGVLESGLNIFEAGTGKLWIVRKSAPVGEGTARVQLIHNADSETVRVSVNGNTLVPALAYRTATPFVDVPAGIPLSVTISPVNPFSSAGSLETEVTLTADATYVVVAHGTFDETDDAPVGLSILAEGKEAAASGDETAVQFFHGVPDAPAVDITSDGNVLFDNVEYREFGDDYIAVSPGSQVINVTPADNNDDIIAAYRLQLGFWKGKSAVIFATGSLEDGSFQPWVALSNGGTYPLAPAGNGLLPPVTDSPALITTGVQIAPNPVREQFLLTLPVERQATVNMYLLDGIGQPIQQINVGRLDAGSYQYEVPVQDLPSGRYYLQILTDGDQAAMIPVIVAH